MSLPSGVNPTTIDRSKPFIDLKTTTVNGVLKQIVTNFFLPNMVDGVSGFYGSVIQVIEDPSKFENGSGFSLLTSAGWLKKTLGQVFSPGQMEKRYKVRIPDLDYNKPNPYSANDKIIASLNESQRNKLLEFFDEFTLSPEVTQTPVLGDIVFVTFGNLETRRDGRILYRVGPVPTGYELLNSPLGGLLKQFGSLLGNGLVGTVAAPLPPVGPEPQLTQMDITIPINAAIRGDPLNPNPSLYARVIDQFSVTNNPRYMVRDVSNDGKKDTFCNILVYDVTRAMGVEGGLYWFKQPIGDGDPIPAADHDTSTDNKWKKGYWPSNAQRMYNWLRSEKGKKFGWKQITPIQAQVAANKGFCVISGGHNHVTVIRPGVGRLHPKSGLDDPKCSSAGGDNVNDVYNSNSFGSLDDVTYHVYISPKAPANFYEQKIGELKSIYLPLEKQITDLTNTLKTETDEQKKYQLKKQIYDITLSARSYGSLLAKPTTPVAPQKPAVASKPRASKASKA